MIRIRFRSELVLAPQSSRSPQPRRADSLLLSFETPSPFQLAEAGLVKVEDGSLPLIAGIFTLEGREDRNPDYGYEILHESWRLNFTPEQAADYLKLFLAKAQRDQYRRAYHLLDANCLTAMLDLLDILVPPTPQQRTEIEKYPEACFIPDLAPRVFHLRGLLVDGL
jgi:hypothetical protein